jgi:hypothetical protein
VLELSTSYDNPNDFEASTISTKIRIPDGLEPNGLFLLTPDDATAQSPAASIPIAHEFTLAKCPNESV